MKSRLVKADAHNHSGKTADEINDLIKRISINVMDIELACIDNGYILDKDMMKRAISDAMSNDIDCPDDIVERCVKGITSVPEPTTRYYKDLSGRYYQFLFDARNFYASHDKYFILQELFGAHERVAVPISKFKPEREIGSMYPITKFEEVSKEVGPFLSLPCAGLHASAIGSPVFLPSGVAQVISPCTTWSEAPKVPHL